MQNYKVISVLRNDKFEKKEDATRFAPEMAERILLGQIKILMIMRNNPTKSEIPNIQIEETNEPII